MSFIPRRTYKTELPNREGLTFEEWLLAANPVLGAQIPFGGISMRDAHRRYRKETPAWLAGEDPTDWRAVPQH